MSHLVESLRSTSGKRVIAGAVCAASLALVVIVARGVYSNESYRGDWQCLVCGHAFSSSTLEHPPVPCPRCEGEAVKLRFRRCPHCGERVAWARMRLTTEGQRQRDEINRRHAAGEFVGVPGAGVHVLPLDAQYRRLQDDGAVGWSDWVEVGTPRANEVLAASPCPKCRVVMPPLGARATPP